MILTSEPWKPVPSALPSSTVEAAALVGRQCELEAWEALLDEADSITAELCRLTGDRPVAACPAFLKNVKLPS